MIKKVFWVLLAFFLLETTSAVVAQGQELRARLEPDRKVSELAQTVPVALRGGSQIHLHSPKFWAPLAVKLSEYLKQVHERYSRIFGEIPPVHTTLKLMEAEEFYKSTGAPRWTNAMYYRGEITIPLALDERIDLDNLERSIKHEYTHSVINALSDGRCPGWLDEGIAQWAEGSVNPALEPALKGWLVRNKPIPLSLLQGGFTRLETMMVPTAYAQSLFATRSIINSFGFTKLSSYFRSLRSGTHKGSAFETAFRMSERGFEQALESSMRRWAKARNSKLSIDTFHTISHNH